MAGVHLRMKESSNKKLLMNVIKIQVVGGFQVKSSLPLPSERLIYFPFKILEVVPFMEGKLTFILLF